MIYHAGEHVSSPLCLRAQLPFQTQTVVTAATAKQIANTPYIRGMFARKGRLKHKSPQEQDAYVSECQARRGKELDDALYKAYWVSECLSKFTPG